jgi:predicted phage-related endonuclease
MKTLIFDSKEEWMAARKCKITGSRLKDIIVKRGTEKKIGFYKLIAERIATSPDTELPMDRGNRLEPVAMERFIKETGKKVDTSLVIWARDEDDSIAISPDGFIGDTEAVECKCLSSADHIKAWLTQKIPDDYEYQKLQYFIVNDKLQKLSFVFYDDRIHSKDYFVIEVKREDVALDIQFCLDYEKNILKEVNEVVNTITF